MDVIVVYTLMMTLLCCVTQGQFIQTHQYHGHWYGLQMQSIEDIAREGLACVVHMELEVMVILYTGFFARLFSSFYYDCKWLRPVLNSLRHSCVKKR